MAKILFYTSTPYKFGREITCTLALSVINSFQFHSVYSQEQLRHLLQNEVSTLPIVILAAMTHQELTELLELRNLYRDMPIVLLLPDDCEKTLRIAHRFRPKFLSTIHHDFEYVLSVVEKLSQSSGDHYPVQKMHTA